MPHIDLPAGQPGMRALLLARPAAGRHLSELAEQLLRGDSPLSVGERELIAAHVSALNRTRYCAGAHGATAAHRLDGDFALVEAVQRDLDTAPVTDLQRALLRLAGKVAESGLSVTPEDIATARAAGADDDTIHDTVLIAAAFCMYNRYVDGLATPAPENPAAYHAIGAHLATNGYL
ncbi:putative peroxidase-related enzyme [Kitasatospora sp. SolWspMP-SS2h]|uniref:carboxymuconolactone decarboxylase family protein n=1 Tax=Kitasatospora sp. SolWspMP-SS2h TaxID=1305729 RepID=UPI000DBA16EB|nr:peroxidase-related enzyme [Kitasatospora sp. SolWspMP-SS2h]RAJ33228.1 putative peroxidase-related enzyme [Kitasatospora sp. SolWspMP-SS2h]